MTKSQKRYTVIFTPFLEYGTKPIQYQPKGFQSIRDAEATVDWLLTHSLFHVIKNWLIARIYWRSGRYDKNKNH